MDKLKSAEKKLMACFKAVEDALVERMELACLQYSKRNPGKEVQVFWAMGVGCLYVGEEKDSRENSPIVKLMDRVLQDWGPNAMPTVMFLCSDGKTVVRKDQW